MTREVSDRAVAEYVVVDLRDPLFQRDGGETRAAAQQVCGQFGDVSGDDDAFKVVHIREGVVGKRERFGARLGKLDRLDGGGGEGALADARDARREDDALQPRRFAEGVCAHLGKAGQVERHRGIGIEEHERGAGEAVFAEALARRGVVEGDLQDVAAVEGIVADRGDCRGNGDAGQLCARESARHDLVRRYLLSVRRERRGQRDHVRAAVVGDEVRLRGGLPCGGHIEEGVVALGDEAAACAVRHGAVRGGEVFDFAREVDDLGECAAGKAVGRNGGDARGDGERLEGVAVCEGARADALRAAKLHGGEAGSSPRRR